MTDLGCLKTAAARGLTEPDRDDSFNKNNKSNKDIEVKIKYVIVLCMIRYFDFSCTCC